MKWLTYKQPHTGRLRAGFLIQTTIIDLQGSLRAFYAREFPFDSPNRLAELVPQIATKQVHDQQGQEDPLEHSPAYPPIQLQELISEYDLYASTIRVIHEFLEQLSEAEWQQMEKQCSWLLEYNSRLLAAPLPKPNSFRDFYAFEEHVKKARRQRGLGMVEEWYHFPVFYFSNHLSIVGPNADVTFPKASRKWDYELEVGIVIGKEGRDISRQNAWEHVFGLMIVNDWSARDLQAEEVKVGLGPAKGKDFATSMGPYIVTAEEWVDRLQGEQLQLSMEAYVNGQRTSKGDLSQLYFSIPQLIERAAQDCTLYPGDVLGTGTVGTGCFVEQGQNIWLQSGDQVRLEIERLGELTNFIR